MLREGELSLAEADRAVVIGPVAYYSDRYGEFRVNKKGREAEPTQFMVDFNRRLRGGAAVPTGRAPRGAARWSGGG